MKAEIIQGLTGERSEVQQVLVRFRDRYFVVSSTNVFWSGFETLVFPANEKGEVTSWTEVAGGRGMSRAEAIADLETRTQGAID